MFRPNPKSETWSLEAYRNFIRNLPSCFRCNKARLPGERLAAHHERTGGGGGTALKPSDVYIIPLCIKCHHIRHSSAFRTLSEFYQEAFADMTRARLYKSMLENLNSFLFKTKSEKK